MKHYFSLILAIAATVSAQIVPSTGNVRGPTSATDNAVARYDGTTGKLIQNSGVTIDDSGNLTVSGTGTSTFSGRAFFDSSINGDNVLRLKNANSGGYGLSVQGGNGSQYTLYAMDYAGNALMTLLGSGNLLIGTTVDSSALLQVGTNTTTAAGGMKFGTDTSWYRSSGGVLTLDTSAGFQGFEARRNGTTNLNFYSNSSNAFIGYLGTGSLTIQTLSGSPALTLDSSQNATFAGTVTATQFKSGSGNTGSVASGAATTLFSLSGFNKMYLVHVFLGAEDPGSYAAFATIVMDGSAGRIVSNNGTAMTITLSGYNVQATQSSGANQTIYWSYTTL